MGARERHVPLRRCVACRRSRPQAELLRLARDAQGTWRLDAERRLGGRGAWVCRDGNCLNPKALGRTFRAQAGEVRQQLTDFFERSGDPDRRSARDGGIDV